MPVVPSALGDQPAVGLHLDQGVLLQLVAVGGRTQGTMVFITSSKKRGSLDWKRREKASSTGADPGPSCKVCQQSTGWASVTNTRATEQSPTPQKTLCVSTEGTVTVSAPEKTVAVNPFLAPLPAYQSSVLLQKEACAKF